MINLAIPLYDPGIIIDWIVYLFKRMCVGIDRAENIDVEIAMLLLQPILR